MTIATTAADVTYIGNGASTVFSYAFIIPSASEVIVKRVNLTTFVETILVQGVDYSIIGIGNPAGGNVTLLGGPLLVGFSLNIARNVPQTQPIDFENQQNLYQESFEDGLDRCVMLIQQLQATLNKAFQLPPGSSVATIEELVALLNALVTEAETAASSASASAASASGSASAASASAAAALASKNAAELAESNAEVAETNAETAETNAETAATNSEASAVDSADAALAAAAIASMSNVTAFFAGTTGGSANAQTAAIPGYTRANGKSVTFFAGFSITTAATLNFEGTGAVNIFKMTGSGPEAAGLGDVVAGNYYQVVDDGTRYILLTPLRPSSVASFSANKANVDQTGIASATSTKVTFPAEIYDTGSKFDSSTWTPPPGKVAISAALTLTGLTAGSIADLVIRKNGVAFKQTSQEVGPVFTIVWMTISIEDIANGTDTYEIYIRATSAGTITVNGLNVGTWFMGSMI